MAYKLTQTLKTKSIVRTVRFNVDGAYCIVCNSDRRLYLFNPHRSALLKTYCGHGGEVMDADSSCDSGQIISGGLDKSVILWDVATASPLRRFRGHASGVAAVKFSEESTLIVSGGRDNLVQLWDVRSRSQDPVQTLSEAKDAISSVRISDHEILTASFDARIRRYDVRVGQLATDCLGDAVTCSSFTRDGQCTLNSCADGALRLLDKDSGELLNEFKGHLASDLCLESSVDSQDTRVLSGSADGALCIWDLASGELVDRLKGDSRFPVVSVSVHPTENCILVSNGSNVFMWVYEE
ncbi:GSCOCG00012714001-RA-CDS [Cotesia congregata]|uniref:WD repeat domain-containing protein 83 n=1 Tax=Cotesia congregata TaxID=51543 RepID=A0A8J2HT45_COTCN|nr:GSCOCG00012714001-RA-CDS [Cotesia congregata]CAG5111009.1 Similar to Wdr83: WD repeat domain-containing protein 83 (Mus musculus) [Cotesia congregata]